MNSRKDTEFDKHDGPLKRFFFRHAVFLMRLYGTKDPESIWHYATMFVTIVLSIHAIFFLALVTAFLPGKMNLQSLSPKGMGVGIGIILAVTAIVVDVQFRPYKSNMAAADKYDRPSDRIRFLIAVFSMFAAIVGYAVLVWWKKSSS